jgi:hypothetical protein
MSFGVFALQVRSTMSPSNLIASIARMFRLSAAPSSRPVLAPSIALVLLLAVPAVALGDSSYHYESKEYQESVQQSDGSSWTYHERLTNEERQELKQQLREQWNSSRRDARDSSRSWSGLRERMSQEEQEEMRQQLREQHYGNSRRH